MTQKEKPHLSAYHSVKTTDELTARNIQTIIELEKAARADSTRTERVVDEITKFFGRVTIIYIHLVWFAAWILINTVLSKKWHFDPYPFEFLVLTLSLEAIFLSIFILISQNRQGYLDERRNHLEMQINLLTEQENTKTLWMLERIAEKVGADISGDPELQVLEEATRPERLLEQIDSTLQDSK
ncbi:MAG: DUF1003 domain-containing protein [Proteobacteria bacterium]|nr:MAG: DUF1003 domain-containing protein [Pseudomonadota bacterium]